MLGKRFFAALLIAAGCVATPAAASDSPVAGTWSADPGGGECAVEFDEPDRTVFLGLSRSSRSDHRVYGTFLAAVEFTEGQVPEIYARTEAGSVLLAGPQEAFERRAHRWAGADSVSGPIARFAELAAEEDHFSLAAPGLNAHIPLTGFAEAYESMQQCVEDTLPSSSPPNFPRDPVLIAFDGIRQLTREASRQGMLSQKLGYTLTVDAQGNPAQCELSRDFRMRVTEIALCRPLLRYMTFEPALDESGRPAPGQYSGEINFNMWMTQDGYLEPEARN